jgi:hypothetical protein
VPVDHARLLVAVQVQPAAHVVGLDEFLRHRELPISVSTAPITPLPAMRASKRMSCR